MLQVDDLAVGLYVTVLENAPIISPKLDLSALFGGNDTSTTTTFKDRSGMGKVMAVIAINLPFVVTEEVKKRPVLGYFRCTYDTRRTRFMAVTPEFMEASEEKGE